MICKYCKKQFRVPEWRLAERLRSRGKAPVYCSTSCRDLAKIHFWSRARLRVFLLERRSVAANGCWLFRGIRGNIYSYRPHMRIENRPVAVAKLALWVFKKDNKVIQRGRQHNACHTCDNPACFNPEHLFYGNPLVNARDKTKKGRHPNSQKTHCPKGHSYVGSNLGFLDKAKKHRRCLTCHREQVKLAQRGVHAAN